jgi:polyhydroxybutyrate depolymerase
MTRSSLFAFPLRIDLLLCVTLGASLFGSACGPEPTAPVDASSPWLDGGTPAVDAGDPLAGRSYDLHEPPGYDGDEPVPLVVMIHPMLASDQGAEVMDEYLGLTAEADERGVLVAIPHGTYDAVLGAYMWNATDSCCAFFSHRPDDAGFIMAMVAAIRAEHTVDPDRIYIIGQSNGGFMAHRLACENADVFAAFVSISGAMLSDPAECEPSAPVAAMHVHGAADGLVPFEGGAPFEVLSTPPAPSAHETIATWADRNGCGATPSNAASLDLVPAIEGAETERVVYSGCEAHGAAELWIAHESPHLPEFIREFIDHAFDFLFAHPKGSGAE